MKWNNGEKFLVMLAIFLLTGQILLSNALPLQYGMIAKPTTFLSFLTLGVKHFTTTAINHLLFCTSFVLLCPKTPEVKNQTILFTIGFLLTEWLTIHKVLEANSYILNSLMLMSIFYIALENLSARKLKIANTRYLFLLAFGLIHGASMGNSFVNSMEGIEQPWWSTFSFSAGLVLGEIAVLAILYLLVGKFFSAKPYYKKWVVNTVSGALAAYSCFNVVRMIMMTN